MSAWALAGPHGLPACCRCSSLSWNQKSKAVLLAQLGQEPALVDVHRQRLDGDPVHPACGAAWHDGIRADEPPDPRALDGDVILAAQARTLATSTTPVLVATTNVGHLRRMIAAEIWLAITPEPD